MSTPGRPRLLDDDKCAEICTLIAAGHSLVAVSRSIGCNVKTIRRQAAVDERFQRQLATAEFTARNDPAKLMRRAASTHWRAAAWLLERTDPDRYSRQTRGVCRIERVEAAFSQLIEAALRPIADDRLRREHYKLLSAIAERETSRLQLLHGAKSKLSSPNPTPRLEEQRLHDYLEEVCQSVASPANASKPDKEGRPAA